MVIKSSILKKLNALRDAAVSLKNQDDFKESIKKFNEARNFVRTKVKEREDINEQLDEIKSEINLVYCAEISSIIETAIKLTSDDKVEEALESFNKASLIADSITKYDLKNVELGKLKTNKEKTEIKKLLIQGNSLKTEENFKGASETYKKALKRAQSLYDTDPEDEEITKIKDIIDDGYSDETDYIVEQAKGLKSEGKADAAIERHGEAIKIPEDMHDSIRKEEKIKGVKSLINAIFTEKISPLKEEAKPFIEQNEFNKAISILKKAIKMANDMHELDDKNAELEELARITNPILKNQVEPIIQNGKTLMEKDDFSQKIPLITEAVNIFKSALNFVNEMVVSEEKEAELIDLRSLINEACMIGIKLRKEKGLKLIVSKQFDDAISELYAALSIAKNMVYEGDKGDDLTEEDYIKKIINQVFSAEIRDNYISKGEQFVEEKKFDEAIEIYKEGLQATNKMYLGPEMDKEVSSIKNKIYQLELKKVVADGTLSDEQVIFQEKLENLSKKLEDAGRLKDIDKRENEMYIIRKAIDDVHSEEISLLIEQAFQLSGQGKFKESNEFVQKTLKIIELLGFTDSKDIEYKHILDAMVRVTNNSIEHAKFGVAMGILENGLNVIALLSKPDLKNEQYVNIINQITRISIESANKDEFDYAFKDFERSLEVAELIDNENIKENEIASIKEFYKDELNNKAKKDMESNDNDSAIEACIKAIELDETHKDSHFNLALAYYNKNEYQKAINSLDVAVQLDPGFLKAWKKIGICENKLKEYDKAINAYNKALEIEQNYSSGWYHRGSAYKNKNDIDEAIKCYKNATEINPEKAKAWLLLGSSYFINKDYDLAIENLEKAFELDSKMSEGIKPLTEQFKNLIISIQEKISEIFESK